MANRVYFSDRGIPLVYNGDPMPRGPVLTVEAYLKWYALYVVRRTGRVVKLPRRYAASYEEMNPREVAWSDHKPSPGFCKWLGRHFEWDTTSLELCMGRWAWENQTELFDQFVPEEYH